VGEAVAKATAPAPAAVAWNPAWERFAGVYRGPFGDQQVVLLNHRLVIITPNATTLENQTSLEPLGDGRFRFTAPTGGGVVGEVVHFEEEGGQVVRMITGDSYAMRVKTP
jgi:D-alanyl-D-alanine carboxypeptidase